MTDIRGVVPFKENEKNSYCNTKFKLSGHENSQMKVKVRTRTGQFNFSLGSFDEITFKKRQETTDYFYRPSKYLILFIMFMVMVFSMIVVHHYELEYIISNASKIKI